MNHLYIYGTGGVGREVLACFVDICKITNVDYKTKVNFVVDDIYYSESYIMGISVLKRSDVQDIEGEVIVAIGDPVLRKKVVESLPSDTKYATLIHPKTIISEWVTIGEGSIISAGCILTTQISLGKHVYLNLNTTIGHDCIIEDYVTLSQGVNLSGNCVVENEVFIGSNTALRQKTRICKGTIIGMSSCVINSITEKGVYAGIPVKLIK